MIVVDATVMVNALGDDGSDGYTARDRLRGEQLSAPHLLELEVVAVWRRKVAAGQMDARRAGLALADLRDLPLRRARHVQLLPRCWELRNNFTIYDAAYVALAEALEVALITADRRLARGAGALCEIELLS